MRTTAQRHSRSEPSDSGFTLIELIVVIAIIAVLSAISIPSFLSHREAAWEAQVSSDIHHAKLAAESYFTAENGSYDGLTVDALADHGFEPTEGISLEIAVNSSTDYTLSMSNSAIGGATRWVYSRATGETIKES